MEEEVVEEEVVWQPLAEEAALQEAEVVGRLAVEVIYKPAIHRNTYNWISRTRLDELFI